MAKVISISSSPGRGTPKYPVPEGNFIKDFGMEGDGHAGNWHRQVCVFDVSSMDYMSTEERAACEETYSENITTEGIELHTLPVGTKLKIGETVLEITQIGKDFVKDPSLHTPREVIMHKEGVFCIVLKSGKVNMGDGVSIV
ncbi:MAG: MOSC domain-containing protein [Spirochaetes bacterium]|nr:MAG: MOSC domain-containing protein [Spirochaetota bacterium]